MSLKAVRLLKNSKEINSARKLLYKVYIEELKWLFNPQSLTKFHIQQSSDGGKMLCDAFDQDALWVGAYKDDKLVGTIRIVTRDNRLGKLDLELYDDKKMPSLAKIYTRCIEMQRSAVDKEYRGSRSMLPLLSLFTLEHARQTNHGVCCTANIKHIQNILHKAGFECLHSPFYYGEGKDEKPSIVMFCPQNRVARAIEVARDLVGSANHEQELY